jgi:hypothetical protein
MKLNQMRGMFYRSLRTIEHALSARREYMTKDGQIINGTGPLHASRGDQTLTGLPCRGSAGRPKHAEKAGRPRITLPELEELLRADWQAKKQALDA